MGVANNTAAFTITTGNGTICNNFFGVTMPTASNGWICDAIDEVGGANFRIIQTADTATGITLNGYLVSTQAAANFTASHTIKVKCSAY